MNASVRVRPAAALVLAALLAGAPAAQDEAFIQGNTAHLRVHPDLGDLVQRVPQLVAQERWAEALGLYESALEKYPDSVVPLDAGRTRAQGLLAYVREQIDAWPEAGKAFVRRRSDPLADYEFQAAKRARDVVALEALIERFPWSSSVDEALLLIGTLRLDAGDEAGALEALERLLARPASAALELGAARAALAYARLGRRDALQALSARAAREFPEARVRLSSGERPLQGLIAELLQAPPPRTAGDAVLHIPSWPLPGGAPSGSVLAEPGVELSRLAWTDLVGLPRLEADENDFIVRRTLGMMPSPEFRPLFPAVADGVVYVHNGLSLTAYSLFARQPERLWQYRVPPPSGEVMFDNRVIYAPVAQDGRVYANLITATGGAEDQLGYVRVKYPFPKRALHAFDAHTGRLLWTVGGKLRMNRVEEGGSFATGPTPDGARLYVGAVFQKFPTDPFEHYVLCLESATGRLLWSTFIASGGTEINLFGNSTRESLGTPVAMSEDAVFYGTNHGAYAALEKKTGRIRWIIRYKQPEVRPTRSVYVRKNLLEWVNSPAVVAEGVAALTPTDSAFLTAVDARDGRILWERPRGSALRTLYGAKGSTLVLGGERLELLDLKTGAALVPPAGAELGGSGRGVLAEDGIYVPCRDRLVKVAWDGTWDAASSRRWPGTRAEGGNLLVVDGALLLASQDSIQVYFDRRDQERTIRAALEKHPDDPALLYRAALRHLQSGQTEEASRLLLRAVERTSKGTRPDEERLNRAARRRLYAVSLSEGRAELEAGRAAEALRRIEEARRFAPDAAAAIEASLELARARLAAKDDRGAVSEYQRLILESGGETLEGAPVFDVARHAIGAVLSATGRAPYEPFEAQAAQLLAGARRPALFERLMDVFRLYPNSKAAEEALAEAAAVQRRLDRPEEEIAALRLYLREFPDAAGSAEAHAALVRVLEKKGHVSSAGTLLRRMLRQFPDAPLAGGTVRDFATQRLKGEAYRRPSGEAPLPVLNPPLKHRFSYTDAEYPEGVPLQPGGAPPEGVAGVLLMHYAMPGRGAVKALGPEGQILWQVTLRAPLRYSTFLEEGLILADENAVLRVDPRTGRVEWTWESRSRMRGFGLSGPHLLFFSGTPGAEVDQRVSALDALRGAEVWTQPFEGIPSSRVYSAGEAAVFITVTPNRVRSFDVETGRPLADAAPFSLGLTAQVIHASEDVLILQSEGRFLEAFDLPKGGLRWRAPLERVSSRAVEVGGEALVLLGVRRPGGGLEETLFLQSYSLKTGKILRRRDAPDLGDPRHLLVEGDQAYVVSLEADGSGTARGLSLADFSVRWTSPVAPKTATILPPFLARGLLGVGMFEQGPDKTFSYGASLLDKAGKAVQNIRSEYRFERPPGTGVAGDRLVFSADAKVDVYR